jgi:CubicO group peptidase (beta-lactamase class C family)
VARREAPTSVRPAVSGAPAAPVFQVASVSTPLASTVVARLVGDGVIGWDDPVRASDPDFALSDPCVTGRVTAADLLSHRSGRHTGAGDLLEDLGVDRAAPVRLDFHDRTGLGTVTRG